MSKDPQLYLKAADELIRSFADEAEKEFQILCVGTGGGMPYDIEEISLKFLAHKHATIEIARKLHVALTERLLKKINTDLKVRPFLREHPFSVGRAEVSISFRQKNNLPYTDGSVSLVYQVRSRIYYRAEGDDPHLLRPLFEEPYDQAMKLVKEGNAEPEKV